MSNVLRLAIVDPNDETREETKSLLLGLDHVWLEADCSRYEFFVDVVAQAQPDIGLVSLDYDEEQGLGLIGKLRQASPDCSILVVSSSSDGSLILRSMRAGAKEFLNYPIRIDDLLAALDRIGNQRFSDHASGSQRNTIISIVGATGGVGVTSLAVNLGSVLAQNPNNSAVLVDLDLCLGDADVLLDSIAEHTLFDVAQNVSRLDFALLKRSLTKHSSGLFLLPRPAQIEDADTITPEALQLVVGLLKASFSHVLLDLSKSFTAIDRVAMDLADQLLLVTQLDLPCLRNIVRLMVSFAEMDGVAEKTKIVVNRCGLENGQISAKKARDTIGRDIFWQLPNDCRSMVECRNNGVPLIEQAPKAKITQELILMADELSGSHELSEALTDLNKSSLSKLLNFWGSKPEVAEAVTK